MGRLCSSKSLTEVGTLSSVGKNSKGGFSWHYCCVRWFGQAYWWRRGVFTNSVTGSVGLFFYWS